MWLTRGGTTPGCGFACGDRCRFFLLGVPEQAGLRRVQDGPGTEGRADGSGPEQAASRRGPLEVGPPSHAASLGQGAPRRL